MKNLTNESKENIILPLLEGMKYIEAERLLVEAMREIKNKAVVPNGLFSKQDGKN